jgi:putative oxidoreductase
MSKEILLAVGLLLLRIVAGFGLATHGYQKLFSGHMSQFTATVSTLGFPIPALFAWAAAMSEFLGGILTAIGLKTRPAAIAAFITMAVAAIIFHRHDPFKTKELALVYMSAFGTLALTGPGRFSLDKA